MAAGAVSRRTRLGAFAPAALFLVSLLPVLPPVLRATVMVVSALLAPGVLVWWCLGGPVSRHPAALPAVAFALSWAALLPLVIAFVFLHVPTGVVAGGTLLMLVGLGAMATRRRWPAMERPTGGPWPAVAVSAMAVARVFMGGEADQVTHVSLARVIEVTGRYPSVNPFLTGQIPLAPRWRVGGWTGFLGAISNLSGFDAKPLLTDLLPLLGVVLTASATFLIARYLGGSRRFATIATVLTAVALPLVYVEPRPVAHTRLWLTAAGEDKGMAFAVLLPVVWVVLLGLLERPTWARAAGGGALALSLFFIHPLMFVFGVLMLGAYGVAHAVSTRTVPLRAALLLGAALVPSAVLALGLAIMSPAYGVSSADIASPSDVGTPVRIGPLTIWQPYSADGATAPPTSDPTVAALRTKFEFGEGARYIIVGDTIMPSPRILLLGPNVAAIVACLLVIFLGPAGRLRLWVIAGLTMAVAPYLLPPLASVLARVANPWILWRVIWLLPLPLALAWMINSGLRRHRLVAVAAAGIAVTLAFSFSLASWLLRDGSFHTTAAHALTGERGIVIGGEHSSRWLRVYNDDLRFVAGGPISGANNYPRSQLERVFRRDAAVTAFFEPATSSRARARTLEKYGVTHVVMTEGEAPKLDLEGVGLSEPVALGDRALLYRVEPDQQP